MTNHDIDTVDRRIVIAYNIFVKSGVKNGAFA